MEYMCSSVDCVCFPLRNDLDRTFPVLESTSGHGADLISGYKFRSQLEVLLSHFQWGQAVCSRYNTCDPEMGLPDTSSVSL